MLRREKIELYARAYIRRIRVGVFSFRVCFLFYIFFNIREFSLPCQLKLLSVFHTRARANVR